MAKKESVAVETKNTEREESSAKIQTTNDSKTKAFWTWLKQSAPALGVIIALLGIMLTLMKMNQDENKRIAESQKEVIREWQSVIVFKIIKENGDSMSFRDISSQYLDQIALAENMEIPKSELQDLVLERILMDLSLYGLIYLTQDNEYMIQKTLYDPRFNRSQVQYEAKHEILSILSSESGKYTLAELNNKLSSRVQITSAEFTILAGQLISEGLITIQDDKVWYVTSPPPLRMYHVGPDGKIGLREIEAEKKKESSGSED